MVDDTKVVRTYLLRNLRRPLQLSRTWWRAKCLYLSDVCLVVDLEPTSRAPAPWDPVQAKDELYALLRWLGHTAMAHDLMRPVAGVTRESDFERYGKNVLRLVRSWGADQEWHRGGFTLYVEKSNEHLRARLSDLIEPRPQVIENYQPKEPRDSEELLRLIDKTAEVDNSDKEVETLVREVVEALQESATNPEGEFSESSLSHWVENTITRAEQRGEGSET